MKRIIIYTLAILATLTLCFRASADTDDGVKLSKTLVPNADGTYTITLEAFVTGSSVQTTTKVTKPVDLVLVLDVSSSMTKNSITTSQTRVTGLLHTTETYQIVVNGTYYDLYYQSGKWMYNGKTYSSSANTTPAATDEIYTKGGGKTRLAVLEDAVNEFIQTVANDAAKNNVEHQIAIVTYSSGSTILKGLTSVSTSNNVQALQSAVYGMSSSTGTESSEGMKSAISVLSGARSTSSRVVVMFTDGTPTTSGNFDETIANNAISYSNTCKTTYSATVFSIGVFSSSDASDTNINTYMSRLSSNWTGATSMTTGTENTERTVEYYQKSDGSDLTSIFTTIASQSTASGGSTSTLSENAMVIDKMSENFSLPTDVEVSDIKCSVWTYIGDGADMSDSNNWMEYRDGYVPYVETDNDKSISYSKAYNWDATPTVTLDKTNGKVTIDGFNYSLSDQYSDDKSTLLHPGNWVGLRNLNGYKRYYGNKLRIQFVVELDPDYEGGYGVPSNDSESSIQWKDSDGNTQTKEFPIPTADFPSLCIIKEGLEIGETAIFEVSSETSGENIYHIALTQKGTTNGSKLPCYVVLKGLTGGIAWTVKEAGWSWTYTGTPASITQTLAELSAAGTSKDEIAAADDIITDDVNIGKSLTLTGTYAGQVYGIIYRQETTSSGATSWDDDDASDGAVVAIYKFANTKIAKPTNLPARAEAYAHNKFAGGTATSGGTETGGREEEDI